ncbi:hypothetical protein [Methanothrix sp.]|uniref:hypothetical protein n=1 Tax=Methanothrix sp. TaxID=90426 RepID=UPI0032AF00CA
MLFLRIGTTEYAALLCILFTAHGIATDGASVNGFQLFRLFSEKARILSIEDAWVSGLCLGMLAIAMEPVRLILPKSAGHSDHRF